MKKVVKLIEDEITLRKERTYSYDIDELHFLEELNSSLHHLENKLFIESTEENHPNIWIIGLPRSATTLLSQIIFNTLDIACTNNLVARFWETPLSGCMLSKAVLGNQKTESYQSNYARTDEIYSPHEFSYFWRTALKMDDLSSYNPLFAENMINWRKLQLTVFNMNRIFGKGMVFKLLEYVGYHIKKFEELFNKSLFIYISRNPRDVAVSIANARLKFYGNLNTWWASYPLDYQELKDKPYWIQIAGQIYYLTQMYQTGIQQIAPSKVITISYEDLCHKPQQFLNEIIRRMKDSFNYEIAYVSEPPQTFAVSKPQISPDIEAKLLEGLQHFNLIG